MLIGTKVKGCVRHDSQHARAVAPAPRFRRGLIFWIDYLLIRDGIEGLACVYCSFSFRFRVSTGHTYVRPERASPITLIINLTGNYASAPEPA